MKTTLDVFLERGYWISQITLMLIAGGAAFVAWHQVRTFRLFELLKFLEDPRIRQARRTIFKGVKKDDSQKWWETDEDLEEAAATVCASFDIVSLLAKGTNRKFFIRNWAHSICWTHETLEGFLTDRRRIHDAYRSYTSLYKDAKPYADK